MNSLKDVNLSGKKVLLRADFNVPMDDDKNITDDIRIRMVLPSIKYIISQGAKLIICSHMGRPKGKPVAEFSLAPIAKHLTAVLGQQVPLAPDCIGEEVEKLVSTMTDGQVLLLENLRFHKEETDNDEMFSFQLAKLVDVYINDAFAVSHRVHASVVGVAKLVAEKGAGFLLQKEMDYFHKAMNNPIRPLVAIVGGAKVSSKIGALENMLDKVDAMVIGGAMANTFLKAQGYDMGGSLVEDEFLDTATSFMQAAKKKGLKVYLPVDFVAADSFSADAVTKTVPADSVPPKWMALDVGPASTILFQEALAGAGTIVWNGPVGAFEMDAFAGGTMDLCRTVAKSQALSITGGGDSNAAVKKSGESDNISYMSTGGGAFLRLMEGKTLPGVDALG
ncbi:MAG: phosphoglycerate kinase [Desulfotalea sp.]